jgi:hypothetical protein
MAAVPAGSCEVEIRKGKAPAFTVSVAALLITVPAVLLTTVLNAELLSEGLVAGVV